MADRYRRNWIKKKIFFLAFVKKKTNKRAFIILVFWQCLQP